MKVMKQRNRILFIVQMAILSTALAGNAVHDAHKTVVLHDAGNTVPAGRYYRQIQIKASQMQAALARASGLHATAPQVTEPTTLAPFFPFTSQRLHLGEPRRKAINQLPAPLFIMGMDAQSRAWFEASIDQLRAMGAQGVIVEADSYAQFSRFQQSARDRGVLLDVSHGDPIAQAYGITTYPMLLVGR